MVTDIEIQTLNRFTFLTMGMQTPPPPQPVSVEQVQKQNQEQNQAQNQNLDIAPAFNNATDNVNNARSNSQSTVNQSPSQVNTQVNNHFDGRITYGDGISVPVPSINLSVFADRFNDNYWQSSSSSNYGTVISLNIPLGGRKRVNKLIDSRNNTLVAQELTSWTKLCTGLINSEVTVDYELAPQFSKCKAFSKATPTPVKTVDSKLSEIQKLKMELQEYKQLLDKQKTDIDYYQQKIEREYEFGTNVMVGG